VHYPLAARLAHKALHPQLGIFDIYEMPTSDFSALIAGVDYDSDIGTTLSEESESDLRMFLLFMSQFYLTEQS
jgi:hypothetical protein